VSTFKRLGTRKYQYAFSVDGIRYRGSTRERTKTAAEAFEAKLRAGIMERGHFPLMPAKKQTLRDFSAQFLEFCEKRNITPNTLRWYRNGWRLLEKTPLASMHLSTITTDDAEVTRFPRGPYNANCALGTLGVMLNKAEEWGLIASAPTIKMRKTQGREATINEVQEKQLIEAIDSLIRNTKHAVRRPNFIDLRTIVPLMLDSGMRPDEVFRMTWENVHWLENRIFIPDGKTKAARRFVPLSSRVKAALQFLQPAERKGWVFPQPKSKDGHRTHIWRAWASAHKLAGLPQDVVLYSLRHTFASRVYAATGNLAAVMVVMGHEDLKSVQRYQHQDGAKIAHEAIERLTHSSTQ
jgi:integrase